MSTYGLLKCAKCTKAAANFFAWNICNDFLVTFGVTFAIIESHELWSKKKINWKKNQPKKKKEEKKKERGWRLLVRLLEGMGCLLAVSPIRSTAFGAMMTLFCRCTSCRSTSGAMITWCAASTWRTCRRTRRAPWRSSTSSPGLTWACPPPSRHCSTSAGNAPRTGTPFTPRLPLWCLSGAPRAPHDFRTVHSFTRKLKLPFQNDFFKTMQTEGSCPFTPERANKLSPGEMQIHARCFWTRECLNPRPPPHCEFANRLTFLLWCGQFAYSSVNLCNQCSLMELPHKSWKPIPSLDLVLTNAALYSEMLLCPVSFLIMHLSVDICKAKLACSKITTKAQRKTEQMDVFKGSQQPHRQRWDGKAKQKRKPRICRKWALNVLNVVRVAVGPTVDQCLCISVACLLWDLVVTWYILNQPIRDATISAMQNEKKKNTWRVFKRNRQRTKDSVSYHSK